LFSIELEYRGSGSLEYLGIDCYLFSWKSWKGVPNELNQVIIAADNPHLDRLSYRARRGEKYQFSPSRPPTERLGGEKRSFFFGKSHIDFELKRLYPQYSVRISRTANRSTGICDSFYYSSNFSSNRGLESPFFPRPFWTIENIRDEREWE
jgi:hypothetical protein